MSTSRRPLRWAAAISACLGLAGAASGCGNSKESRLAEELQDLQSAREHVQEEAEELRSKLEESRQEVRMLEEKLQLAQRGLTDEVIKEREDLKQALAKAKSKTANEVEEAKRLANNLNEYSPAAEEALSDVEALEQKAKAAESTHTAVIGEPAPPNR